MLPEIRVFSEVLLKADYIPPSLCIGGLVKMMTIDLQGILRIKFIPVSLRVSSAR